jgi:two-component system chemotaxis sensor kinase CheA
MSTDALIVTFQREAEELLLAIEEGLLELESAPDNADTIDVLFRAAHTLKGNAGMVGLTEIVRLTHVLENVLDRLRARKLAASEAVIEALLSGLDALKDAIESSANGVLYVPSAEYESAIVELSALCDAEELVGSPLDARLVEVELYFRPDFWASGEDLTTFLDDLALLGEVEQVEALFDRVPALSELAVSECYLGLRAWVRTTSGPMGVMGVCFLSAAEEQIRITDLSKTEAAPSVERPTAPALTPAFETAPVELSMGEHSAAAAAVAAVAAVEAARPAGAGPGKPRAGGIRVDTDKLDRLLDLVGELVIGISQVQDRSNGATRAAAAMERLEALGRDLQDQVMSLRMLPIHDTFERFRRPIRDLAKDLGKRVEFSTSGGSTQVDKKVIDSLADPLKHMLRNCVSHGIETLAERETLGKPSSGTIHLSATQREGHVLIEISDDGRGIDSARVLAKAQERGLVAKGQTLSEAEIYELLFLPGFSTAAELSEISGRGVGLDVVKRAIQALRGSIETLSRPGRGTTFRIRLPLTLAIVDGMNVRVGAETVTIPLPSVVELIAPGPSTLQTVEGKHEYLDVRGQLLPVLRLSEILALPGGATGSGEARVVIVETERRKFGLLVDSVVGMAQTVIKPLDSSYDLFAHMTRGFVKPRSVNGAAILGDGNVGIILDVHGVESTAFGAA